MRRDTESVSPLTPQQQRAADLLGAGWKQKLVAAEVGVTPKSIQRWTKRADFQALVGRRQGAVLDENPSAKNTLQAALAATTASGTPDWRARVSAARALISAGGPIDPDDHSVRETVIYTDALDG